MEKVLIETLKFLGVMTFVYLYTRFFGIRYEGWQFPRPCRSSVIATIAVTVGVFAVQGLLYVFVSADTNAFPDIEKIPGGINDLISHFFLYLIALIPVFIALKVFKEPLRSAGVNNKNIKHSLILGILYGIISVGAVLYHSYDAVQWRSGLFWLFLSYGVVGFGEEFAYRGYLQTRLMACLGNVPGWIISSVYMAMLHFGHRVIMMNMSYGEAFVDCLGIIPISLLLGYAYWRTGNILAPGIAHTFANWVNTL